MVENLPFEPPQITDEDVGWVCDVLELPKTAFSGVDGKDPRLEILKSTETLDIEACPGSGKTTLLVAKLAILARKWTSARQGVCVLSHTNVARREIEKRLGNTAAGQHLLSYPHFVGTIHSFVNEFLAMPWLRSLGIPVRVIDNQHCEQHRRRLLTLGRFSALAGYVNPREASGASRKLNVVSGWRVASPAFDVLKDNDEPEFKNETNASKQLRALVQSCAGDGYHRFDEMFMWGHDLLEKLPEIRAAIRQRFPMLFIDEVQDNNEDQSRILYSLFMEGENPARRQRYGDSNQAIYGYAGETGATSDPFPDQAIRRDIPNSHRFGQQIADIAKPLGLVPQSLVGCGPQTAAIAADTSGKHAIFLFTDQTIQRVVPSYADYLCEVFSVPELRDGDFTVVAGVHHRRGENDKIPRFLGQYWPAYDPELTASEPTPTTFCQYVMAGRKRSEQSGESHHLVEKVAEGIFRLVRLSNPTADLGNRKRKHRHVLELLADKAQACADYRELVTYLAADRIILDSNTWDNKWSPAVTRIAEAIGNSQTDVERTAAFMQWQPQIDDGLGDNLTPRDNCFRHPATSPKVSLRVGSIHSVKGETHTATLVLDTYYVKHHLATLKPWLLGTKQGKGNEGVQNQARLKQHYVAMTRPTHLLCLAVREDAFSAGEIDLLKSRSWRVARVSDDAHEWL